MNKEFATKPNALCLSDIPEYRNYATHVCANDASSAENDLLKCLSDYPLAASQRSQIYVSMGMLYLLHQDFDRAENHFLNAEHADPESLQPLLAHAKFLIQQAQRPEEALLKCHEILQRIESGKYLHNDDLPVDHYRVATLELLTAIEAAN